MSEKLLDEFGKAIVSARDAAVRQWDKSLAGQLKGETAEVVRQLLSTFTPAQLKVIKTMMPMIVDTTIHHVLWMLEQSDTIKISVSIEGERTEDLNGLSDGLTGEYPTEDGWIGRFATQRYRK